MDFINLDFKRKQPPANQCKWLFLLVAPMRFERMAYRLGGGCSIHLSYGAGTFNERPCRKQRGMSTVIFLFAASRGEFDPASD